MKRYVHLPFHGGCSKDRSFGSIIRVHYIGGMSTSFSRVCSSIPLEGGQILLHNHLFFVAIHDELCRPIICFFWRGNNPKLKMFWCEVSCVWYYPNRKIPIDLRTIFWETLLISEIPPLKTKISHENWWLEDDISFKPVVFQGTPTLPNPLPPSPLVPWGIPLRLRCCCST